MAEISWGVYSVTLLIGSLQGALIAQLLFFARANRAANRALALLILAVVLLITPYTLGFAGFFDRYKWLNFAPLYWDLAFGPLIWLYVRQLGMRNLPRHWRWHFFPVALQAGYYSAICLLMPIASRESYNDHFHSVWILPTFVLIRYLSYLGYAAITVRAFLRYQNWLADHSALREEFRLDWLRRTLWLIAVVLVLQAGFSMFDIAVRHLPYREEFPLYVLFAVLIWLLGLEGWRHAARIYPKMDDDKTATEPTPETTPAIAASSRNDSRRATHDWPALAIRWIEEIRAREWWREPDLSLALVARRLGTNTAYLSRALNEGAGQSFSDCINRLRIDAAKKRLQQSNDGVLDIALSVGFASKASFNRVFKSLSGETPSDYRKQTQTERLKS